MSNIKEIYKLFENGIIPNEFFYNTVIRKNIDFYKLYYNDYYKSPDYIASKLPAGWEFIPGFDQVIEEKNGDNELKAIISLQKRFKMCVMTVGGQG